MNAQERPRPGQRRLVIGVGRRGLAVLSALQRRLDGQRPAVQRLALLAVSDETPLAAQDIRTVATPAAAEARAAPWAPVEAALVEAMLAISQVQSDPSRWPATAGLAPEVALWLVGGLEGPGDAECLLAVAALAQRNLVHRFNLTARIGALLLLPGVEEEGTAWREGLVRIHRALCSGPPALGAMAGSSPKRDALLDQGCFLLAPFNRQGLALGTAEERNELAAELLRLLVATDAARVCDLPWSWGGVSCGFGSLGLAAWVLPVQPLIAYAARRMALELLDAWRTPRPGLPEDWWEAAARFWQGVGAAAPGLAEQVAPAAALDETGLWRPVGCPVTPWTARRLRQALEEQVAERVELLAARRAALEERAEALAQEMAQHLATAVDGLLDEPAPGRLPEAAAWLAAAQRWLETAQGQNAAAAEVAWHQLEALERSLAEAGERLEARATWGGFPERGWRSWAGFLLRPWRWVQAARALVDLRRLAAGYVALLLRQTHAALAVLRSDLAGRVYVALLAAVERQRARVQNLTSAAAAAAARIAPWPPPLGALGFSLERSLLTPESVESLYGLARGEQEDLLRAVARTPARLGGWPGADPDGEDLAGTALDFATHRCREVLAGLTVDDLLCQAMPAPHDRLEALYRLMEMASPLLAWDETRMDGDEAGLVFSCVVLGLGQGAAAPALAGVGEVLFGQVMATGDPTRALALQAVAGIPLAALAGMDVPGDAEGDGTDPAAAAPTLEATSALEVRAPGMAEPAGGEA
ncbi:MAG: hypothetical protein RMN53_11865 [Anaerolineae bacterium]|nr:hypothetical protein [Anaerolineae bacterium]